MKPEIFDAKVEKIENLGAGTKCFWLDIGKEFDFEAGQYVSVDVPNEGKVLKRFYSICSSPSKGREGEIELCVKKAENGVGTSYLFGLKKGDVVKFMGPMGRFVLSPNSRKKDVTASNAASIPKSQDKLQGLGDLAFIAGGTGIAPFRSMILSLLEQNYSGKIILLVGFRHEEDVLFDEEFRELEKKHKNFVYRLILSRPAEGYKGDKGHVQVLVEKYLGGFSGNYYLCGRNVLVEDVLKLLAEKGVGKAKIFYEKYG